jgi:hypothetical protein
VADPVLATVDQLEAFLGHTVDATRATALLEFASAVVRGYAGQHFSRVVDDVATVAVNRGQAVLPQRPAEKPTQVANYGGGAIPTAGWWWGGVGIIEFGSPSWVANGPSSGSSPRLVEVTYTHGFEEIPTDVVAVVCQMVARVIDGGDTHGLRSESIDDYQYQMGGNIVTGALALVPSEKETLDRYRRRSGSVGFR